MIEDFYTTGKLVAVAIFFFLSGFFSLRTFYDDFKKSGKFEIFILSVSLGILINILIGFLLGVFEFFTAKYLLIANIFWIIVTEILFFMKYKKI